MATFNTLKTKIQGLIDKSNAKTGNSDTDLTSAVDTLIAGFGQGGSSLPEYDGTVIIEKAESPLGLKKFNEDISYTALDVKKEDFDYDAYLANNFIEIEPIEMTINSNEVTWSAFTPFVKFNDDEDIYSATRVTVFGMTTSMLAKPYTELDVRDYTINVLSTANSTVGEWLLANTEGVSV